MDKPTRAVTYVRYKEKSTEDKWNYIDVKLNDPYLFGDEEDIVIKIDVNEKYKSFKLHFKSGKSFTHLEGLVSYLDEI